MSAFQFYQHHENIYYTNRYYKKVKRIRETISELGIPSAKVPKLFQIITDFDRTLTHPLSYQCHGLFAQFSDNQSFKSTVNSLLNGGFQKLYPNKSPQIWWQIYHKEMVKCRIQKHSIDKLISVNDRVWMRDYAKQLFNYCLNNNIPILIVSAGITNLIRAILIKYQLLLPNITILANNIHWNDNNNLNSTISHFGPCLTSYNKEDTAKYIFNDYFNKTDVIQRRFVIFMGDSRTDPNTMKNVNNVSECIYIGFILPHRMKEIDIFLNKYDIVIATKNASLEFCNNLLHSFLNGDHILTKSELKEEEFDDDEIDKDKLSEMIKFRAKKHPNTFTHSFTNLMTNYVADDQQLTNK